MLQISKCVKHVNWTNAKLVLEEIDGGIACFYQPHLSFLQNVNLLGRHLTVRNIYLVG